MGRKNCMPLTVPPLAILLPLNARQPACTAFVARRRRPASVVLFERSRIKAQNSAAVARGFIVACGRYWSSRAGGRAREDAREA